MIEEGNWVGTGLGSLWGAWVVCRFGFKLFLIEKKLLSVSLSVMKTPTATEDPEFSNQEAPESI